MARNLLLCASMRSPCRRIASLATAVVLAGLACGCGREKSPTPPEVSARFHALLDTLDADSPGASAEYLDAFLKETRRYQIADSVETELKLVRAATIGRYHEARALARKGEFDQAERMLKDLARVDTEDGKSARDHLEFEFYIEKARWLLVRQRFEESKAVADWLLTQPLNRFQTDEVERILDYSGHVGATMGMVEDQKARDACRQLMILLANVYVNDGTYPPVFSLADLERLDPYSAKSVARELASIENYQATQDHYSLVAVSKTGQRFRIKDGEIED